MGFNCYLCEKNRVWTTYFCDDCRKIKNIMNVYGSKDVLSIIETTCLRNQEQIGYKVNNIIKKKKVVEVDDVPVIKVQEEPAVTRCKAKKLLKATI
jgi:glutaredoxin